MKQSDTAGRSSRTCLRIRVDFERLPFHSCLSVTWAGCMQSSGGAPSWKGGTSLHYWCFYLRIWEYYVKILNTKHLFASLDCYNKCHSLRWFTQVKFVSHSPGGWALPDQGASLAGCWWGLFGLQAAALLLYPHKVQRDSVTFLCPFL